MSNTVVDIAERQRAFDERCICVCAWLRNRRGPPTIEDIRAFVLEYEATSERARAVLASKVARLSGGRVRAADEARRYLEGAGPGWRQALTARWRRAS